jgi:hypothetical protein
VEARLDALDQGADRTLKTADNATRLLNTNSSSLLPSSAQVLTTGAPTSQSTDLRYYRNLGPESPTSQSTTEENRVANGHSKKVADRHLKNGDNVTIRGTSTKVLTTAELADRLTVKRSALNERLRRAGGARLGFELDGWRCVGKAKPARGGPAQWQWAPVG